MPKEDLKNTQGLRYLSSQTTLGSTPIHLAVLDPEFIPEFEDWNVGKVAYYLLTSHFLTARKLSGNLKFRVAPIEHGS